MKADGPASGFGCKECFPESAAKAWEARNGLARETEVVGESHFQVLILACRSCRQRFVSVFTESIDWDDGEDPQNWLLLPLMDAEAARLAARSDAVTEQELEALGPGRRALEYDHPKDGPARTFWSAGLMVGPHD